MQFQLLDWEDPLEERHGNPLSLDWIYGYNNNYFRVSPFNDRKMVSQRSFNSDFTYYE